MCNSLVLIIERLFLIYCFAMCYCTIYFTLGHVIRKQSIGCSVMDVCNNVRYISNTIVDIFMLKTNLLNYRGGAPAIIHGLWKILELLQAAETIDD